MKHIKKFNAFNEEFSGPQTAPSKPQTSPTTKPGKPQIAPSRPSPIRRERPSVDPPPKAKNLEVTPDDLSKKFLKDLRSLGKTPVDGFDLDVLKKRYKTNEDFTFKKLGNFIDTLKSFVSKGVNALISLPRIKEMYDYIKSLKSEDIEYIVDSINEKYNYTLNPDRIKLDYNLYVTSQKNEGLSFKKIILSFLLLVVCANICYYNSTDEITIHVKNCQKEGFADSEGRSKYKYIVYTDNEVFENTDEVFMGKMNSSDLNNELEGGGTFTVKVIGWRNPLLSSYRNIVEIK